MAIRGQERPALAAFPPGWSAEQRVADGRVSVDTETGKIATITRTDGTTQATYNGHPLYTYIGDHGPGTASGNNINLNGGLWLDVPVGSG